MTLLKKLVLWKNVKKQPATLAPATSSTGQKNLAALIDSALSMSSCIVRDQDHWTLQLEQVLEQSQKLSDQWYQTAHVLLTSLQTLVHASELKQCVAQLEEVDHNLGLFCQTVQIQMDMLWNTKPDNQDMTLFHQYRQEIETTQRAMQQHLDKTSLPFTPLYASAQPHPRPAYAGAPTMPLPTILGCPSTSPMPTLPPPVWS
ncbi:hypothetical protein DM01DRAFT_313362 [Hesseltinella vesiculosa]|uniref:Uncharacterized protein n=1 Tax=Hesseltinella vesiculosa TaxID=101127 RepID=A0A1X2GVH5_9FUNG|nr:hypothetical protein DM01DRAFT_313362 [Hesseltinella vesiculosa]